MQLTPANILGSWYADETLSWSAQKTVNWLPETAEVEGTRTLIKLATPPGLRAVVDLGTNAPIRGMENVEGRLFVVSGTSLFEVFTDFTTDNKGNIPGVSRVSMAHNKQGGGAAANELFIANGLSGYVYNTATDVLAQVTDDAFEGAMTADYVDGFITITDPQGRFWAHSGLNQATQWNSIDRYDAESAPDKIVSHIVSHREVMVFGTRTTEFFRNTGAATGTFARVDGTELEIGICSPFARARVDNSVGWVGNDLTVYRLNGHAALRISTRPIEQVLARVDPNNIFCDTWEDRGHKVLYVTSPQAFTLGYDFATGMWHERDSYDLPRWRVNNIVSWNGMRIAGDFTNGKLYVLDWDTHHEDGLPMVSERATGYTHADQNKVRAAYAELMFDTGGMLPALVTISGDLPDGFVGDAGVTSYLAAGGFGPYTFTIVAGSLPPGATMDVDGQVTYSYTTLGNFAWTVMVTDVFGDSATLEDSASIAERRWIIGPLTGNQYLLLNDVTDLTTGTLMAQPAFIAGGVTLISSANGVFFMHGDVTHPAGVSFDGGVTWSQCNASLVRTGLQASVSYNGNFYYHESGLRSVDGITWSAIPNWPVTGGSVRGMLARESDGAVVVTWQFAGLTRTHFTLNDGASPWTQTDSSNVGGPERMATDGNVIAAWTGESGGGPSYTNNFWVTFTTGSISLVLANRPTRLSGAWLWSGNGNWYRDTGSPGSVTTVLTGINGPQSSNRQEFVPSIAAIIKVIAGNVYGLWYSTNDGVSFTQAAGTFNASDPHIAGTGMEP